MRVPEKAWFQSAGSLHESSEGGLVSVSRKPSGSLVDQGLDSVRRKSS